VVTSDDLQDAVRRLTLAVESLALPSGDGVPEPEGGTP
jgi:hypothetical protein